MALIRGLLPQEDGDAFGATVLETALIGRHPHIPRWQWEGENDVRIARDAAKFPAASASNPPAAIINHLPLCMTVPEVSQSAAKKESAAPSPRRLRASHRSAVNYRSGIIGYGYEKSVLCD